MRLIIKIAGDGAIALASAPTPKMVAVRSKMFRRLEEFSRHNRGFVFFDQQVAKFLDIDTSRSRKRRRAEFCRDNIDIVACLEKLSEGLSICFQHRFRARGNLRELRYRCEAESFH